MNTLQEVLLEALIGLSPIWAAMLIGAICWAARYFGGPTETEREKRRRCGAYCNGKKEETHEAS